MITLKRLKEKELKEPKRAEIKLNIPLPALGI